MHALVRAHAHIYQSSECICVLARVRELQKMRLYELIQSCKSIGVCAHAHLFQSSESIGVLTRARVLLKMCARTLQILLAYVRLSNQAKVLVCVRTHTF
jgi:hypothetical protein